ncbi:MAG: winged helix-turn-helix domain-containing protein [Betaproteobacteria bacterium]|nr:winged helix-turn-helix domain-containing protein [Betaproteobacteria bacterium]
MADAVLRLIWQKQRISRAEIAGVAGLSRPTVSEDCVGEILPMGIVTEVGEGPRAAARPHVLKFRDDACVILGDGGHLTWCPLTDLRGRVLAWHTREQAARTDPRRAPARVIDEMADAAWPRRRGGWSPAGRHRRGAALPGGSSHPTAACRLKVMPDWGGRHGLEGAGRQARRCR